MNIAKNLKQTTKSEIVLWIKTDGDVVVSDPSIELLPLFHTMGFEGKQDSHTISKYFSNVSKE